MTIASLLLCVQAFAQLTPEEVKAQYERQVRNVGYSGLGVENIIDKWERVAPDDCEMLLARFNYYLTKSITTKAVPMDQEKYLGSKPSLVLKNESGKDINYFEVNEFDEDLFARSAQAIDKVISLAPDELSYRFHKLNALLSYEKESPDIAREELDDLINYNSSVKPSWKYNGEPADDETFESAVQEYCYSFFRIGTPGGYEAFRQISEKMSKLHPKSTTFLANLGSYWLVAKQDNKKALQYYNKVLKIDPKDYTAAKNCVLLARKEKDSKLEKKYLPILMQATDSEAERESCRQRLAALH